MPGFLLGCTLSMQTALATALWAKIILNAKIANLHFPNAHLSDSQTRLHL